MLLPLTARLTAPLTAPFNSALFTSSRSLFDQLPSINYLEPVKALRMRSPVIIVLIVLVLLPVNGSACACRAECTSANQIYSVACTANLSCFQYDWDETGDPRSPFKNDLSNAMCASCVRPRGLVAKKGCERFTSLAARLCCVSLLRCLCCLPIGFALWVHPPPPHSSARV